MTVSAHGVPSQARRTTPEPREERGGGPATKPPAARGRTRPGVRAALRRRWTASLRVPLLATLPALGGCGEPAGNELLARAAGYELSVDEAADLLARQTQLPDQADVVEAIANLWIDYVLFAVAAAEDSTFQHIDLVPLVRREIDQELVARLRERVIEVDTVFTEEELRRIYEEQAAGVELRARHILLALDPAADAATADSVMEFAEGLRERIAAGEDFAALAGEFSQDPGSAAQGGDLGSFRRGQMVPAFDSAAFALSPGELSGPVRTGFGVHILRVDERSQLPFEEARAQFEPQLKLGLVSQAEEAYLARVMGRAEMEPVDGGADIARQLAARPNRRLGRRAAARELFRFEGGAYTAGDFQHFLGEQGPPMRAQVRNATDDQLTGLLGNLAQTRILVGEAQQAGISLSQAERDSLLTVARTRFTRAARDLELTRLTPTEEASTRDAIIAIVRDVMQRIVGGDESVPALGHLSFALREEYRADVYENSFNTVTQRTSEFRVIRGRSGPVEPPDSAVVAPNAPPPGN